MQLERLLILSLLVFSVGCSDASDGNNADVTPTPDAGTNDASTDTDPPDAFVNPTIDRVEITPANPVVVVESRLQFEARPLDADGNVIEVGAGIARWESGDPATAPISSGGEVLGVEPGTVTITATFREVSASVELQIVEAEVDTVEVLPGRVVFAIGETFEFLAVPRDTQGDSLDGLDVRWSTDDASVATVVDGTVTAVGPGETDLVAAVVGVQGRATLVVEDAVLNGFTVDAPSIQLAPGRSFGVPFSFTWQDTPPNNLPTVAWTSTAPAVAQVNPDGTVTALSPGMATIDATVGSFSDSVAVEVFGDFDQVDVGADHACARIRTTVYCWGDDSRGRLGHAAAGFARVDTGVEFQTVAVGRAHVCAQTPAGAVWCWGANEKGQLGLGNTTDASVPTKVADNLTGRLYASRDVTCAGDQCWGDLPGGVATNPTTVRGGDLYVGARHSCKAGTETVCSGDNSDGQIGVNSTAATASGTPVGGYSFGQLTLGDAFTCGIVSGGGLGCWGDGDLGQIGDGNFADVAVPILTPLTETVGDIAAGARHICIRVGSGDVLCWGGNGAGQVGNGTSTNVGSPTQVNGTNLYVGVDSEENHTCGLLTDGRIFCWGNGVNVPTEFTPTW